MPINVDSAASFRSSNARTRLILLVGAVAALFVALLLGYGAWDDRVEEFRTAEKLAQHTAVLVEQHADSLFEQSEFLVREVADIAHAAEGAPVSLADHQRLRDLVRAGPHIHSAFVADAKGQVILSSLAFPAHPVNLHNAYSFRQLAAGEVELVVGRHPFSAFAGEPTIGIMRPIRSEGRFIGVAAVLMSTTHYKDFFDRIDIGYPLSIALVREDGRVLVQQPPAQAAVGYTAPVKGLETMPDEELARGVYPLDGMDRIIAINRIGHQDVWVLVGLDVQSVEDRWMGHVVEHTAFMSVSLVGITSLTVLAIGWASRERRARAGLELANRTLESRVADRTAALTEANTRLSNALKDKETLFREVHHRVKNNLQIIASLLRLQSMRMPPEVRGNFEDTLNRIHSMGLVHELLYRSNQPANVNFGEYLEALASCVAESNLDMPDRVVLEMKAEPLALDLETAIPMGLLVNELLTNALKHAFPNGRRGVLRVMLTSAADGSILLRVEDDGIGLPPSGATGGGIGLTLVRSLAEQVGARLEQSARQGGGSVWCVELPGEHRSAA